MKEDSKKEIWITIISGVIILITTIVVGYLNMQKEEKQVFIYSPELDSVNFKDYFGLKKGKIFKYSIQNIEIINGLLKKDKKNINVRVIDEFTFNNNTLFILDNDFFNLQDKSTKTGVLFVGNLVYFISNNELDKLIKVFKGIDSFKKIQFDGLEAEFILPFFNGQKISNDLFSLLRKDNRYIYVVQKEGSSLCFDGDKMIERPRYKLFSSTLPDSQLIEFIPYVGIVKINYHHNGSKNEQIVVLEDNVI